MPIFKKGNSDFPKNTVVEFEGKKYTPDFVIKFSLNENDDINLKNCICLFAIRNPENPTQMIIVFADELSYLNSDNINNSFNGYKPEHILCFTSTKFPLNEFKNSDDFKHYGLV